MTCRPGPPPYSASRRWRWPVVVPAGLPLAPMPPVAPMPPPVTSAAELAEEIVALLHDQSSMVGWERVLAGLVTCHATEPARLRDALVPILDRYERAVLSGHILGRAPGCRNCSVR